MQLHIIACPLPSDSLLGLGQIATGSRHETGSRRCMRPRRRWCRRHAAELYLSGFKPIRFVSAARIGGGQTPHALAAQLRQSAASMLKQLACQPQKIVSTSGRRAAVVTRAVAAEAPPRPKAASSGTKEKIRVGINGASLLLCRIAIMLPLLRNPQTACGHRFISVHVHSQDSAVLGAWSHGMLHHLQTNRQFM